MTIDLVDLETRARSVYACDALTFDEILSLFEVIQTLEARAVAAEGALDHILDVAPRLPTVHQWMGKEDVEERFDAGLRHKSGLKPFDYLLTWLSMLRPFAVATRDDSWGEMEKLLCIVMRNYVRTASAADLARARAAAILAARPAEPSGGK